MLHPGHNGDDGVLPSTFAHETLPTEMPYQALDLFDAYNPAWVTAAHEFLKGHFPLADEMDPVDVWTEMMEPPDGTDNRPPTGSHHAQVHMHVRLYLVPGDGTGVLPGTLPPCVPEQVARIAGGTVFEYYLTSNCALMRCAFGGIRIAATAAATLLHLTVLPDSPTPDTHTSNSYIAVAPQHRRTGLARTMVQDAFSTCKQKAGALPFGVSRPVQTEPLHEYVRQFRANGSRCPPESEPGLAECVDGVLLSEPSEWLADTSDTLGSAGLNPTEFKYFFCETNAPGVEDGVMDPAQRHRILFSLGFRHVPFYYVQPPLSQEQSPCYDLLLLALDHLDMPAPGSSSISGTCPSVDRAALLVFLADFAWSCHHTGAFVEGSNYWKKITSSIRALPPLVPTHSPPWHRANGPVSEPDTDTAVVAEEASPAPASNLPTLDPRAVGTVHLGSTCRAVVVSSTGSGVTERLYAVNLPDAFLVQGALIRFNSHPSRACVPAECSVDRTVTVTDVVMA
eukprot:gene3084-3629_t